MNENTDNKNIKDNKENKPMGRPLKGKDRRMQIGVYVSGSVIDMIDEYVAERQLDKRSYSRSDFFNEALEKHMKDLGMIGGGTDDKS